LRQHLRPHPQKVGSVAEEVAEEEEVVVEMVVVVSERAPE
jgi:hypothetical protein